MVESDFSDKVVQRKSKEQGSGMTSRSEMPNSRGKIRLADRLDHSQSASVTFP